MKPPHVKMGTYIKNRPGGTIEM